MFLVISRLLPAFLKESTTLLVFLLFIVHVIEFGVVEYIRAKAHRQNSMITLKFWREASSARRERMWISRHNRDLWSDLDWQLFLAVQSSSPCPAILELLLERGADPQYIIANASIARMADAGRHLSVWQLALIEYMDTWFQKSQEREKWQKIVGLMIKHGAPIQIKVIAQAYEEMARRSNAGMAERDDIFCSNIVSQLKIMKQGLK
jgi:hypothetical protein